MPRIDEAWSQIRAYNLGVIDEAPTMPGVDADEAAAQGEHEAPTLVDGQVARARARDAKEALQAQEKGGNAGPAGLLKHPEQESGLRGSARTVKMRLDKFAERVGKAPTPGGLGSVIAGIAVFGLAIIPVNGSDTRLALLWKALTGQCWLPGTSPQERNAASANGIARIVGAAQLYQNNTTSGLLAQVGTSTAAAVQAPNVGVGGGPAMVPSAAQRLGGANGPRQLARRGGSVPYHISSAGAKRIGSQSA